MTRSPTRTRVLVSVVGIALLGVSGCSSTSVAIDRYKGAPPGVEIDFLNPEPAAVIDADGNLALVTLGSSSCPPTATSIEATSESSVAITLASASNLVCTSDIAATTHILPLPAEVTERPLTVNLVYSGESPEVNITVP